jgi:flagellar biogenesis protein FliO
MKFRTATICLAAFLIFGMTASLSRAKEAPSIDEPVAAEASLEKLDYAPESWPDAPDTAAMLRRLVLGTATVLGLCIGSLFVGRRWLRGAPARVNSGNKLRLVETVSLGNRCVVHLIQSGNHQILVGVDGTGVRSLVPLPPSFEQAIADVRSPEFETVENLEGNELAISYGQGQS